MTTYGRFERAALFCVALLAAACGSGEGGAGGTPPPAPSPAPGVGPAGGMVTGPNGSSAVIPPGALAAPTPIEITAYAGGAPGLASGVATLAPLLVFLPHGTRFAQPVTVTIPYDTTQVAAGSEPALHKTNGSGGWERVANARAGAGVLVGDVTAFSWFAVTAPAPGLRRLIIEVTGAGRVRSDPDSTEIFCGNVDPTAPATDCEEIYPQDRVVAFVAEDYAFGRFLGWRGDCVTTGSRVYTLAMAGDRRCGALFDGRVDAEPVPATVALRAGERADVALDIVPRSFTGGDSQVTLTVTACPVGMRCVLGRNVYRIDDPQPLAVSIEALAPAPGTHTVSITTRAQRVDASFVDTTSTVTVLVSRQVAAQ